MRTIFHSRAVISNLAFNAHNLALFAQESYISAAKAEHLFQAYTSRSKAALSGVYTPQRTNNALHYSIFIMHCLLSLHARCLLRKGSC